MVPGLYDGIWQGTHALGFTSRASCLHGRQRRILYAGIGYVADAATDPSAARPAKRSAVPRGVEDAGIAGADFSFSGADPFSRVNATWNAGHAPLSLCGPNWTAL
jgi:hypothetical protein